MTLGESIAQARQQAGLSIDAVAERTRIRPAIIRALEADDLQPSGGPVYARGHVRSIAAVLGVDPSDWLAEIGEPPPASSAPLMSAGPVESGRRRNGPNWTLLMAVVLLLLVAVGGWQLLAGGGDATPTPSPSATPTPSSTPSPSVPPTAGSPAPSSPAPSPTPSSPPATDGVVVVVTATGTSWISGTEGSTQVFQGTLQPGDTREFTDPEQVRVVIGNAGAVALTVNGRALGAPGADGEVVRLTFGPGDPTAAAG